MESDLMTDLPPPHEITEKSDVLMRASGWLSEPSGETHASTVELIERLVSELKHTRAGLAACNQRESQYRHFVTFMSPGTFVAEQSTRQIEAWCVKAALEMAEGITERHGAVPYAFYFYTMELVAGEWEPRRVATSATYYLAHCKVETLEEIEARDNPEEYILRENMRRSGWKRIVTTTRGWKWSQPFHDGDVVLSHE